MFYSVLEEHEPEETYFGEITSASQLKGLALTLWTELAEDIDLEDEERLEDCRYKRGNLWLKFVEEYTGLYGNAPLTGQMLDEIKRGRYQPKW